MQQPMAYRPQRIPLPQGIRTWIRVLVGACAVLYLAGSAVSDGLLASSASVRPLVAVLMVLQLFVLCFLLDFLVRGAYLDGSVVVDRRLFGVRRCDLARAAAVRVERKGLGLRLSAHDGRRWTRVPLRPSAYRGPAATHPLLALADAILAGPPRPEPMGREAWAAAQQLRQAVAYLAAAGQQTGPVRLPRA
ncbi:MAG TPA: hypothetical protein VF053_10755 [Streptosporangiales bacterium]